MVIKSKQVIAATLIVALGAAVAVNWYYSKTPTAGRDTTTAVEEKVSGSLGDSVLVAGTTAAEKKEDQTQTTSADSTAASDTMSQADADAYFAEAKLKRTKAHDEIIDSIEDILENDKLSQSDKSKVTVMLADFRRDAKSETDAENLIKAKTGSECIVTINNGNCQVVLEKNTLNDVLILQITEIIEKNTNISAENLTIIELK